MGISGLSHSPSSLLPDRSTAPPSEDCSSTWKPLTFVLTARKKYRAAIGEVQQHVGIRNAGCCNGHLWAPFHGRQDVLDGEVLHLCGPIKQLDAQAIHLQPMQGRAEGLVQSASICISSMDETVHL